MVTQGKSPLIESLQITITLTGECLVDFFAIQTRKLEISMFLTVSKCAQIKKQRDSIVYFQLGTPFKNFLCASDKSYKELD